MLRKIALAAALCLLAVAPASAASKLYITEYTNVGNVPNNPSAAQIAAEAGKDQVVDFSGGVASSTAFAATTKIVRAVCDSSCSIKFGPSPQTATTSSKFMAAGAAEYFGVTPGQIVSVISNP